MMMMRDRRLCEGERRCVNAMGICACGAGVRWRRRGWGLLDDGGPQV
jgi:hypothetical protein